MLAQADGLLRKIDETLGRWGAEPRGKPGEALRRWRDDCAATRFHLSAEQRPPLLVGVFGGTGTGKSTLVNRLLGERVTAASFRRTFTSGTIAIAGSAADVPAGWLGVEHVIASPDEFPLRGRTGALLVATVGGESSAELMKQVVLVDTPDLDGDQPAHHAEADRAFRWVHAAIFLVTPEKYQMTELLPYYGLAERYGLPALFVMNKAEHAGAVADYAKLIDGVTGGGEARRHEGTEARSGGKGDGGEEMGSVYCVPFVVPRDGAGFAPAPGRGVDALRTAVMRLRPAAGSRAESGKRYRVEDLLGRLVDQVIAPLRERRLVADRLAGALRGIETPAAGVDVNPVTQQLRQRLQQRSVLYLIGPQRILERLRQAPGLLARLPRVAWDYVRNGEISAASLMPSPQVSTEELPDFRAILTDQFAILQSRIDDILRSSPAATLWLEDPEEGAAYTAARIDPAEAGKIADEEIASLRDWLGKRWDATPRDTRILMTLLKHLPGGKQLTRWTEAAPYLLTLAVVTHHALFGHVDLLVLGGYSLATWLSEKISNEVSGRTRATNQRIADRFTRLAHEQIERTRRWLDERAPSAKAIEQLDELAEEWE